MSRGKKEWIRSLVTKSLYMTEWPVLVLHSRRQDTKVPNPGKYNAKPVKAAYCVWTTVCVVECSLQFASSPGMNQRDHLISERWLDNLRVAGRHGLTGVPSAELWDGAVLQVDKIEECCCWERERKRLLCVTSVAQQETVEIRLVYFWHAV